MNFEYIWGILETKSIPPHTEEFNILQNGYKFYPFKYDGSILTFDISVWNKETKDYDQLIFSPTSEQVCAFLKKEYDCLFALTDQHFSRTIDRDQNIKLIKIPTEFSIIFSQRFKRIGFDVLDVSGISALTNIGYNSDDIAIISKKKFNVNEYGLIENYAEGKEFSNLVSIIAEEHAPFFPIEIWGESKNLKNE